jgi:hypothetical protein
MPQPGSLEAAGGNGGADAFQQQIAHLRSAARAALRTCAALLAARQSQVWFSQHRTKTARLQEYLSPHSPHSPVRCCPGSTSGNVGMAYLRRCLCLNMHEERRFQKFLNRLGVGTVFSELWT